MQDTSVSLLIRLKQGSDPRSWDRLIELYTPLLHRWLRYYDVPSGDRDDLVQEVLLALSKELCRFEHNGRPGAFRSWLRTTLVHRLRNYRRARARGVHGIGGSQIDQRLAELEDPTTALTEIWNRQHDRHVLRQMLSAVEREFEPTTWRAFRRSALEGRQAREVAEELQISPNAVFIAKSRVLRRLRHEAEGMVESASDFSGHR